MASRRSLLELADLHEKGRLSRKSLILAMCREVSPLVSSVKCSRVERAAMRMALRVARARALGKATREDAYKASDVSNDVDTDAELLIVSFSVADVAYCASLSETSHFNRNVPYYNDWAAKSARGVHNYNLQTHTTPGVRRRDGSNEAPVEWRTASQKRELRVHQPRVRLPPPSTTDLGGFRVGSAACARRIGRFAVPA